jgi:hypothetical protein
MVSELLPLRYLNRPLKQEELQPHVFAAANQAALEAYDPDDPNWFTKFRTALYRDLQRRKALVHMG